ncbi:hypothetical protein HU200_048391 [Digitaria exilis]|uniref:Uncharacterized protein n=1 Tax=Digitaria exilis TaxID=1010633 RepID=A0A835EAN3_9POAL|nr:hypothetical protein HU200_048391 [Digitaria exilis]
MLQAMSRISSWRSSELPGTHGFIATNDPSHSVSVSVATLHHQIDHDHTNTRQLTLNPHPATTHIAGAESRHARHRADLPSGCGAGTYAGQQEQPDHKNHLMTRGYDRHASRAERNQRRAPAPHDSGEKAGTWTRTRREGRVGVPAACAATIPGDTVELELAPTTRAPPPKPPSAAPRAIPTQRRDGRGSYGRDEGVSRGRRGEARRPRPRHGIRADHVTRGSVPSRCLAVPHVVSPRLSLAADATAPRRPSPHVSEAAATGMGPTVSRSTPLLSPATLISLLDYCSLHSSRWTGESDGMDEEVAMAAASSECSSGCQSGWTTYLDDHSSYSNSYGTGRFHGKARRQPYYCDDYSEEDDLSMISDASSGPRQQSSTGNDVQGGGAAAVAHANAERRGRREAAAAARRQSKRAANASQLEDTASSPAFYGYTTMMELGNAADFSYAFSTTTGFKVRRRSLSRLMASRGGCLTRLGCVHGDD